MQAALDAKVADILSRASELREQFRKQGYLCFEALVPEEDCDALRARANELVEQFDPTTVRSVFTTGEKQSVRAHKINTYIGLLLRRFSKQRISIF